MSTIERSGAEAKAYEAMSEAMLFVEELTANEGRPYAIEGFAVSETVQSLKQRIATAVGKPNASSSIEVVFAGELMEEHARALSSYGVKNGDTVYFIRSVTEAPPPYLAPKEETPVLRTLFFRDLDGKSLTLENLPIDMKMSDVFAKLAQEKSLNTDELRFIWSGKQLQGNMTIRDYGIMNESTVHIVARLRGG